MDHQVLVALLASKAVVMKDEEDGAAVVVRAIGDTPIALLGENTHGTREFYAVSGMALL